MRATPSDTSAHPSDPERERERAMREYKVSYDGCSYEYNGYRYERLDDALAYARLMRARPGQFDPRGPYRARHELGAASETDQRRMATLGIELEDGRFRYAGFRYDRLADAVNYALLQQERQHDALGRVAPAVH